MKNISIHFFVICSFFCLTLPLYGQDFRFALITDLHVTKDSLAYNDLKRTVEQINNGWQHT
jgi:hypothetical protein